MMARVSIGLQHARRPSAARRRGIRVATERSRTNAKHRRSWLWERWNGVLGCEWEPIWEWKLLNRLKMGALGALSRCFDSCVRAHTCMRAHVHVRVSLKNAPNYPIYVKRSQTMDCVLRDHFDPLNRARAARQAPFPGSIAVISVCHGPPFHGSPSGKITRGSIGCAIWLAEYSENWVDAVDARSGGG